MNAKLSEILAITAEELDAEGPADVAWVSIEEFETFGALVFRSVCSGGLDELKILGNPAANGSGTDVTLKDYATLVTLSAFDAVGDWVFVELSKAELHHAMAANGNAAIKGICVSLGHAQAADESVIIYLRGGARNKNALLTALSRIA